MEVMYWGLELWLPTTLLIIAAPTLAGLPLRSCLDSSCSKPSRVERVWRTLRREPANQLRRAFIVSPFQLSRCGCLCVLFDQSIGTAGRTGHKPQKEFWTGLESRRKGAKQRLERVQKLLEEETSMEVDLRSLGEEIGELSQSLPLDLPYPLARQIEPSADLPEGLRLVPVEAKAQSQY